MEFQDVVRKRRMHRRFTSDPVPPEAVDRMLRNAVRAPSAGFSQGWDFVVLDDAAALDRFWTAAAPGSDRSDRSMDRWLDGMRTAPVLILVLASKAAYLRRYAEDDKGWTDQDEARWPVPFWHLDAGMASLLILQTVVDEGLGACFFGVAPDEVDRVRAAFGIPDDREISGVIAVGHPQEGGAPGSPARRARRPMEDVVHRGGW